MPHRDVQESTYPRGLETPAEQRPQEQANLPSVGFPCALPPTQLRFRKRKTSVPPFSMNNRTFYAKEGNSGVIGMISAFSLNKRPSRTLIPINKKNPKEQS